MKIVAGDIGGTKTLLRHQDGDRVVDKRYDSTAYTSFDDLLADFLKEVGAADAACFAIAGPVIDGRATVTNTGWTLDERALPIERVMLINDFMGIALGVPLLEPGDLLSLHEGKRDRTAPIAILGAGTGLGEALVIPAGDTFIAVPTEGGHQDFAPQDEEQTRLFLELHRRYGHVSWERLVSGMGLVNIFTFLGGEELEASDIGQLADEGDPRAVRTFEIFVDLYGAEAGNMALRVLARGGVFLAGGIAAKNTARFQDGRFVEAFVRKGRFRDLMTTIPVDLITNEQVGLIGAMEGARRIGESR